jgi:alcohol dehydrogenase class IV
MSNPSIYASTTALDVLTNLYPDQGFHILRIPELSNENLIRIRSCLNGRLVSETIYESGMPDISSIQHLQGVFWDKVVNTKSVLLGIGGGSVMDVAKVLRFRPDSNDWLNKNLDTPIEDKHLFKIPLILVPTTAGTGSEVTPTATMWDFKNQKKYSFFGSEVLADVAIVDPQLCLGAPWILSRDSAIDALSHALEAIWNTNSTPETTQLAIFAAGEICECLPTLKNNLENSELRDRLSRAALSAGLAMAKTQTALAHALSYAETISTKMSHGQACAYWLPVVWQLLVNSQCDVSIKLSINHAIGKYFSSPIEMYHWLVDLGFLVHPPLDYDQIIDKRVSQVRLSARGKNFAGFYVNY